MHSTTPYLPLTVSASVPSASLLPPRQTQPSTRTPSAHTPRPRPDRAVSGGHPSQSDSARAAHEQSQTQTQTRTKTTAPARPSEKPPSEKPSSERRRSTLTSRFPLLRKGSREVPSSHTASLPSIHLRGSSNPSNSPIRLPSSTDSPFLSTGEPRASTSSLRGRIDRQSDQLQLREPSATPSNPSDNHDQFPDSASTHSTTPLRAAAAATSIDSAPADAEPVEADLERSRQPSTSSSFTKIPDRKMHQTSSRLLRMTDDERPFTRSEAGKAQNAHEDAPANAPSPVSGTRHVHWAAPPANAPSPESGTQHVHEAAPPANVPSPVPERPEDHHEGTPCQLGPTPVGPDFFTSRTPGHVRGHFHKSSSHHKPNGRGYYTYMDQYLTSVTGVDFKDLFSTLMVSLPLTPHRVRFRMIEHTFTSDEAITNLGSLKFSQSNRMPDPKDSSRVVTTTTTTTFSMAKEMARSVCAKFLEAKFIESVEGKTDFQNKSSVWQLTPKGIHILERFCSRNGIQSAHVKAVIDSQRNPHQLVILERDTETDKLHHDEQTVEIIFRRFVGLTVNEVATSDSDSIHEFSRGDVGVRMLKHKPTTSRPYEHVFTGKATVDWLMDCCTMVDRREGHELGSLFLELGLIAHVDSRNEKSGFVPTKQCHYYVTPHGEQIAGWSAADDAALVADSNASRARDGSARDSNSNRTNVIIKNPSWRLLYREFLKETMCEENLSFYLEVQDFNSQYKGAINSAGDHRIETIRETLAAAYGLYNAFLAPGSPNELNIDHALRTQLATRMTRAVGDDNAMMQSLKEVHSLFDKASNSIFKLMSSDSVPKFIKHPKYAPQLRGLDAVAAAAYTTPSAGTRS